MLDLVKKYIHYKRPDWDETVVRDISQQIVNDDFKRNNVTTKCEAILFLGYVFSKTREG